jgi:mandelate racemase
VRGVEVSFHLYSEFSAHLLRVTETAHWLEWQDWANPILAEPFTVAAGCVAIPSRAGAGLAWNEEAVRRFRLLTGRPIRQQIGLRPSPGEAQ